MSWTEFWTMGGYAPYVWGSYGAAALLFATELIRLRGRRRAVLQRLRRMRRIGAG